MRTIKEDFIWVSDYSSPLEFAGGFKAWVERYNSDYPHSSLKYLTPCQFEKEQLLLITVQTQDKKWGDEGGKNYFSPLPSVTNSANRMNPPKAEAAYLQITKI